MRLGGVISCEAWQHYTSVLRLGNCVDLSSKVALRPSRSLSVIERQVCEERTFAVASLSDCKREGMHSPKLRIQPADATDCEIVQRVFRSLVFSLGDHSIPAYSIEPGLRYALDGGVVRPISVRKASISLRAPITTSTSS